MTTEFVQLLPLLTLSQTLITLAATKVCNNM